MANRTTNDSKRSLTAALGFGANRRRPACYLLLAAASSGCLRPPPAGTTSSSTGQVAATGDAPQGSVASVPYVWKSVAIEGGGFVTGLVYSPVKAGILYARTDVGGAYRYEPSSRTWTPLTDFLGKANAHFLGIESIAADPVQADRVYMAVGMYTQSWGEPGGFMRSDDRGDHWQVIPTPNLKMGGNEDGRANGERLAVDPNQPKILYFGSRKNGLWKSEDEAATWSQVESFPLKEDAKALGIPFIVFEPKSGKPGEPTPVIYAGVSRADASLYRSSDAGKTWELLRKQPTGFLPSRAALDRDGKLYVSYGVGPGPYAVPDGALYRFEPKTGAFTDISPLKPSDTDRFGYGAVAIDASRPGTLVASTIDRWTKGGEIFRSTDSGKTWKALMAKAEFDSAGVAHVYHHRPTIDPPQWVGDIKIDPFDPNNSMLITGGGIWATENLTAADDAKPTRWSFRNRNLEETVVHALVSPPEGAPLVSGIMDLCGFRHDDLEKSPARGNYQNPSCANGEGIDYAGGKPSMLVRVGSHPWDGSKHPRGAVSLDGGQTWQGFASEPTGSDGSGNVVITADGSTLVWAARSARVAYSRDRGATWSTCAGLPDPAKTPDWAPVSLRLAADRVNPKKVYAFDALNGSAFTSVDGGEHFTAGADDLPPRPDYDLVTASIQSVPGFEGEAWVTSGKQLAHSKDGGKTFTPLSSTEESYAVGFGRPAEGRKYPAIYLSGKVDGVGGFFRSDDEGEHFVRINDDAHRYGTSYLITGDPRRYGRVYVAPPGRGILYGDPK
jgi:hypothetical protein